MEFNNLKAAAFVVIAMSMITTNDAIVKHLTQVFNVGQIMFLRGAVICVIVFSGIILLSTEKRKARAEALAQA